MMLHSRIKRVLQRYSALPARIVRMQEALGRIEQRQIAQQRIEQADGGLAGAEFRVFSQWGEDGIIQHLVRHVPLQRRVFVEFGVENYVESNTRFLITHNAGWAGLVMDGSADNIDYIKRDPIYWACNLKAEHGFITRENIDSLLAKNGIAGDIGLLSVDIDGNDYWVWQAIDSIAPRIVVCEYNSHFGPTAAVTVPYDPGFVRDRAHFSKIYYGASIAALGALGRAKGYALVAGNSAGNNVFFVRNDVLGSLREVTPAQAYRRAQFREFHGEDGMLTFDDFATRVHNIRDLEVHDLTSQRVLKIAQVPGIVVP
jgi:hypothetical protein